jgi:hypothetical protein
MVAPELVEGWLSEQCKYRQFTPEQKAEIVLAGLRGDQLNGDSGSTRR